MQTDLIYNQIIIWIEPLSALSMSQKGLEQIWRDYPRALEDYAHKWFWLNGFQISTVRFWYMQLTAYIDSDIDAFYSVVHYNDYLVL